VASIHTPWQDVEKYDCGRWVDNKVETTAYAIKDLLGRDLTAMGLRGKKYIRDFFSWSSVAERLSNTFQKILNESKPIKE
jgi:glycosyltransferase involved in cell wall biosynthesis